MIGHLRYGTPWTPSSSSGPRTRSSNIGASPPASRSSDLAGEDEDDDSDDEEIDFSRAKMQEMTENLTTEYLTSDFDDDEEGEKTRAATPEQIGSFLNELENKAGLRARREAEDFLMSDQKRIFDRRYKMTGTVGDLPLCGERSGDIIFEVRYDDGEKCHFLFDELHTARFVTIT